MKTITPEPGLVIRESCRLREGVYVLPRGLTVAASDIVVDGSGVTLVGPSQEGVGIAVAGQTNVTLQNIRIRGYYHGVAARDVQALRLESCDISSTAEVAPNTIFLDIWKPAEAAYGGAILLVHAANTEVRRCSLMHQQNGLLSYHCRRLTVAENNASYNSGFGFYLYDTCESLFESNGADYCCRFEPREGGRHYGHMGADAAGFVAVYGSSCNLFRNNAARMGGDGFFLAGMTPDGMLRGCDDNLFEENDGSLSPNIAFEATFCRGNVFRNNFADRCNFGFWLGFSAENVLEGNRMIMNRQAGIAVENGVGFQVRDNTLQGNGHGVLLWSRYIETFAKALPDRLTSADWQIEGNTLLRNVKGIRIAANQDHGIRPGPQEDDGREELRPRNHRIVRNNIQDNRVGIELMRTDDTLIEANMLHGNVEANLRQDDARGTTARNNLGSAGAYLL